MLSRSYPFIVCLLLAVCPGLWAAPLGLRAMLEPPLLAFPADEQIKLVGTTAAQGAGQDYRLLAAGQTATLATIKGPAVVHRIWSTAQFTTETRLTLKLDGQARVLWERGKRPPAAPADDPLEAMDGQAFWSYIPLEVSQQAEFIATDLRKGMVGAKTSGKAVGEPDGNKVYLQVAYSVGHGAVTEGADVERVRKALRQSTATRLADLLAAKTAPKGDVGSHGMQMISLAPGMPVRLPAEEHAVIDCMVFVIRGLSFEQLRNTRLVMKSDGAAEACVDVPLPFLAAAFWEIGDYAAPLTAVKDHQVVFALPIPVGKGLELALEPMGGGQAVPQLQLWIQTTRYAKPPPYRLCAEYRTMISKRGEPLHLADIRGEGVFVGCAFAADGLEHRKFTFLEGNEQVYVDGAQKPTWEGTGTEDFFNAAWYFSAGLSARTFHGLTYLNEGPPPRMSAYRFLIADRIGFKSSLRFDMQHGSRNSAPDTLYRSVCFWYQKPPCKVTAPVETKVELKHGPAGAEGQEEGGGRDYVTLAILAVVVLVALVVIVRARVQRRR